AELMPVASNLQAPIVADGGQRNVLAYLDSVIGDTEELNARQPAHLTIVARGRPAVRSKIVTLSASDPYKTGRSLQRPRTRNRLFLRVVDGSHRVIVLATPGCRLIDIAGLVQVFSLADRYYRELHGTGFYDLDVVSADAGRLIRTDTGFSLAAHA